MQSFDCVRKELSPCYPEKHGVARNEYQASCRATTARAVAKILMANTAINFYRKTLTYKHTRAHQCAICATQVARNVSTNQRLYDNNADCAHRCATEADTLRQRGSVSGHVATRVMHDSCRATLVRVNGSVPTLTNSPTTQAAATVMHQIP